MGNKTDPERRRRPACQHPGRKGMPPLHLSGAFYPQEFFGFFVGQVMKESKGQANPVMVNELLKKKLTE